MVKLSLGTKRTISVLRLLLLLSSDRDISHHAGARGGNPRVCLQVSLCPDLSSVNVSVTILKSALPHHPTAAVLWIPTPLAGLQEQLLTWPPAVHFLPLQAHCSVLLEVSARSRCSPPLRTIRSSIFSISSGGSSPS